MPVAEKLLAVFISTHETLRAERMFKEARIKVRTTIKPRKISSNCQMAITFSPDNIKDIRKTVTANNLKLVGYYKKGADDEWTVTD